MNDDDDDDNCMLLFLVRSNICTSDNRYNLHVPYTQSTSTSVDFPTFSLPHIPYYPISAIFSNAYLLSLFHVNLLPVIVVLVVMV